MKEVYFLSFLSIFLAVMYFSEANAVLFIVSSIISVGPFLIIFSGRRSSENLFNPQFVTFLRRYTDAFACIFAARLSSS